MSESRSERVTVKIVEQPELKFKYRYLSETKWSGALKGANRSTDKKTCPAISILALDYTGPGVVLVSCVTENKPHKPHPHCLVGKNCTSDGVCKTDFEIQSSSPTIIKFPNLGIRCMKRGEEIKKSLTEREKLKVDPFRTGFSHKENEKGIDLFTVRLCFQVFLLTPDKKLLPVKPPLVSNPIYDSKKYSDLVIVEMSHCTSKVSGGKKIMIFCERVIKESIKVRFFEENNDKVIVWEDWGILRKIHRQFAISFLTPRYKLQNIKCPVNVHIQLVSGRSRGPPLPFQYIPDNAYVQSQKKRKIEESEELFAFLREFQADEIIQNILSEPDKECIEQQHGHYSSFPILSNNQPSCSEHLQQADQLQQNQEIYQRSQSQPSCSKHLQQLDQLHPQNQGIYQGNNIQSQCTSNRHEIDQLQQHNQEIYRRSDNLSQPSYNRFCQQTEQLQHNQELCQMINSQPPSSCSKRLQQADQLHNNQGIYQSSHSQSQPSYGKYLQQGDQLQQNQEIYEMNNSHPQPSYNNLLQQTNQLKYNHEIYQMSNIQPQSSCSKDLQENQEIYEMSNNELQPTCSKHLNQSNHGSYQTLSNTGLFLNCSLNANHFYPNVQLPQTHSEQRANTIQIPSNVVNTEKYDQIMVNLGNLGGQCDGAQGGEEIVNVGERRDHRIDFNIERIKVIQELGVPHDEIMQIDRRSAQQERDEELARVLQQQENKTLTFEEQDRVVAMEAQEKELARMLQERACMGPFQYECNSAKSAEERARLRKLQQKQEETENFNPNHTRTRSDPPDPDGDSYSDPIDLIPAHEGASSIHSNHYNNLLQNGTRVQQDAHNMYSRDAVNLYDVNYSNPVDLIRSNSPTSPGNKQAENHCRDDDLYEGSLNEHLNFDEKIDDLIQNLIESENQKIGNAKIDVFANVITIN